MAMANSESGLEVRDRMWLKITIPNAFIGKSSPGSPRSDSGPEPGPVLVLQPLAALFCSVQGQRWWTGSTGTWTASSTGEKLANTPGTF